MPLIYNLDGPVEISKGRGDLRYSSVPLERVPLWVALAGGKNVSYADIFATQPWVAAAVMRMLTWAIRVPLKVYRREDNDSRIRLRPSDHLLARAVADPWRRGTQAQLIMNLLGPLLVHGNSLTQVEQGAANRIRFRPADWRFATPIKPQRDTIAGWDLDTDDDATTRTATADQVLHLAWWSPLGPQGVSPLQQLGVTINIEDAAQRYQKGLFANGARPPSAITADTEFIGLPRDEREALIKQLREDVTALHAGPDNAGKPPILPPGLDWKPVGHTAVEAELIDQRKVAREEIAAVYLLPPPMVGILDKATYSNIQTAREMAYTDSLGPPLVLIEQLLTTIVAFGLLGERDVYVEFDFAAVLRGDPLKQISALREAISMLLLTPNEGRSILNYDRSDNELADELWVPANNLRPLSDPNPPQKRGGGSSNGTASGNGHVPAPAGGTHNP